MGQRSLILASLVASACGGTTATTPAPVTPPAPVAPIAPAEQFPPERANLTMRERVVFDFERAVKKSKDEYLALFDFASVGQIEVLLHRYDIAGRLPNLPDDLRQIYVQEDGTPYTVERERRNVGNFYPILAQRTVGTGGCAERGPRTRYAKLLGEPYETLPPNTPPKYEGLRKNANEWLAKGGMVSLECDGGEFGLVVVYTERNNPRGYDLITIYDD
ncbi:MAG: hypothetical protein ACKV2T_11650 [Kofleriaceae bacterium]